MRNENPRQHVLLMFMNTNQPIGTSLCEQAQSKRPQQEADD